MLGIPNIIPLKSLRQRGGILDVIRCFMFDTPSAVLQPAPSQLHQHACAHMSGLEHWEGRARSASLWLVRRCICWIVTPCNCIENSAHHLSVSIFNNELLLSTHGCLGPQLCLTLWPHGLQPSRLLCPWGFSRQEYWSGLPCLLQGIFPIQGSNPGLPHCGQILYWLSHQGSPRILEWVAYPFSRGSSQCRNQTGVSCITGRSFTSWATREVYQGITILIAEDFM